MADITLSSGSVCKPYRTPWGAFHIRTYGVSTGVSSAAIQVGRVVTLDYTEAGNTTNAGYIKASTADNYFYTVGIALSGVSGSTGVVGTECVVAEANPMQEFSAATKGAVLSNSNVGLTKTLHWDSTLAIAYVDLTASTATDHRVVVTQLIDQQGDSGGRVAFRFITGQTGNIQGSSGNYNSTTPILAFYR